MTRVIDLDYQCRPSQVMSTNSIITEHRTLLDLVYADAELDKQSTSIIFHQNIDGMFLQSLPES